MSQCGMRLRPVGRFAGARSIANRRTARGKPTAAKGRHKAGGG